MYESCVLGSIEWNLLSMADNETPLGGGNVNETVVRVGDTVRRKTNVASPSVHRLLNTLATAGFSKAPNFLGIDEKNREVLSFIDGYCTVRPEYWKDERYLVSAANLLKEFHDASATYIGVDDDVWAYEYPNKALHEVICHNDFAPYNLIANKHEFVAVIDFDAAGPGPRIRDVAYAAYWMVPISQHSKDMQAAALADTMNDSERLKRFCAICSVPADKTLLNMIGEVLKHMSSEQVAIDMIGEIAAARLKADGHLAHWLGEALAFDEYRGSIEKNL